MNVNLKISILKVLLVLTAITFFVSSAVLLIDIRHRERGLEECQLLKR